MFKIEELAGSLIKSGRFKDAIPAVVNELCVADRRNVISQEELYNPVFGLMARFMHICLNPSDFKEVQSLGDAFLSLAIRSNLLEQVEDAEYEKNVKESREG